MKNINSEELCQAVKGRFLRKVDKKGFQGVCTDSRSIGINGKIFFALHGSQFDGHEFISEVLKKNIGAIIVHRPVAHDLLKKEIKSETQSVIIQVEDTLKSLGYLAAFWREKINLKVIGITGSVGKTTTKHLCLQLLHSDFSVIASPKSFNNVYGVPLSILSVEEGLDFLIQEIGMNQKGEIKHLCEIARPQIATVVTIGSAHIGHLGSKESIAKEKEYIYRNLPPNAVAVFNKDDSYTQFMYKNRKNYASQSFCFSSQDKSADVFLQIDQVKERTLIVSGHVQGVAGKAHLSITGSAHLCNILSAVTLALAAGLKPFRIWDILPSCSLPSGRNQWIPLSCGAKAFFDAYNASPESVTALLNHFLSPIVKGRKILILGDFLELDSHLLFFQKQWVKILAESQLELLWFIGEQSKSFESLLKTAGFEGDIYISESEDPLLAEQILTRLDDSFVLGFKASRKIQMEKILAYFKPLMSNNELFIC